MSLVSRILSRLFQRAPRYDVSGYRTLYNALVARLMRPGVTVGSTAKVPRVEIHSIRELERLDKEGMLRQLSFTVESISNKSLGDAVTMNEDNLKLLTETELEMEGWRLVGIVPTLLQDLPETSDTNKILYRILQEFNVWLECVKEDEEIVDEPIPEDPQDPIGGEVGPTQEITE